MPAGMWLFTLEAVWSGTHGGRLDPTPPLPATELGGRGPKDRWLWGQQGAQVQSWVRAKSFSTNSEAKGEMS